MGDYVPSREDALVLLKEYNESDSLIRHALSVEGVMGHFADKLGEDREKMADCGLVHDLDYEKYRISTVQKVEKFWKRIIGPRSISVPW